MEEETEEETEIAIAAKHRILPKKRCFLFFFRILEIRRKISGSKRCRQNRHFLQKTDGLFPQKYKKGGESMARHNYATVYCVVCKILIDDNGGNKTGFCGVKTIMSTRDIEEAGTGYQLSCPAFLIHSSEKRIVEVMSTLQVNDIIEVTGFIATAETDKKEVCPQCGTINYRVESCVSHGRAKSGGNRVYLYPIAIRFDHHCETAQEAFIYLRKNREFVNHVFLLGNLTADPVQGVLMEGTKKYARYQLAINRKYCPREGNEIYTKTDYPWVYSYGEKSDEDFKRLKLGSTVYVDGAIQARKYKEQYICTKCGEEFDVPGRTLEILAYDTEYLSDHDIDED